METNPKTAVVLLSGGLDSATVLAIAKSQGYEAYALSFSYGQRHIWELEAAGCVARSLGVTQHRIATIDLRAFGGSALTDEIGVPKGRAVDQMSHGIPVTYVPARNTIFLSFALAWAEVLGCSDIFIGVNALDYSGYPDCRPEFIEAFERMARQTRGCRRYFNCEDAAGEFLEPLWMLVSIPQHRNGRNRFRRCVADSPVVLERGERRVSRSMGEAAIEESSDAWRWLKSDGALDGSSDGGYRPGTPSCRQRCPICLRASGTNMSMDSRTLGGIRRSELGRDSERTASYPHSFQPPYPSLRAKAREAT